MSLNDILNEQYSKVKFHNLKRLTPYYVECSCGWNLSSKRLDGAPKNIIEKCKEDRQRNFNNHLKSMEEKD